MNHLRAELRRVEADERRSEREAKKRQRELDRRLKEQAKLSALEQARLEVEAHENALEVLLSVHKEQSPAIDWSALASALPPHEPARVARHDLAAIAEQAVSEIFPGAKNEQFSAKEAIALDGRDYEKSCVAYEAKYKQWDQSRALACRVINGEAHAYAEAVSEYAALAEIARLDSSLSLTVHNARLIACTLEIRGREIVPTESKSLTAGGKVSVKPMPKARFDEIYQRYVCGCLLRFAREVFAVLPVELVLAAVTVKGVDSRTGHIANLPILSLAAPRAVVEHLDFRTLDPSDSLANFQHRGEVMASRKTGEFVPIVPLTPSDLTATCTEAANLVTLTAQVSQLRAELTKLIKNRTTEASNSDQTSTGT